MALEKRLAIEIEKLDKNGERIIKEYFTQYLRNTNQNAKIKTERKGKYTLFKFPPGYAFQTINSLYENLLEKKGNHNSGKLRRLKYSIVKY